MDIHVKASQNSIFFNFHSRCRQSKPLELAIIRAAKSIFSAIDPKELKELHIDSGPKGLQLSWINSQGEQISCSMEQMVVKQDFKDLKKLAKSLQEELHITFGTSQTIANTVEGETYTIIEQFDLGKELPEPSRLQELAGHSPEGNRLAAFFRRFFTYHLVLKPALKAQITNRLEGMLPAYYRSKLPTFLKEGDAWVDHISNEYSNLSKVYTREELKDLYKKELIEHTNASLKKAGSRPINASELKEFEIGESIVDLQEGISSPEELEKTLMKIPASKMNLEELAKIPITAKNRTILVKTWVRCFAELYTRGHLNNLSLTTNPKDQEMQKTCALKYQEAGYTCNRELANEVSHELAQLSVGVNPYQLNNFLIASGAYLNSKFFQTDPRLQEKQRIYQKTIQPILNEFIEYATHKSHSLKILQILAAANNEGVHFVNRAIQTLSPHERHLFSPQELSDIFYQGIEQAAIHEYSLTSLQLENLRALRSNHFAEIWQIFASFDEQQGTSTEVNPELLRTHLERVFNHPIKLDQLIGLLSLPNLPHTPLILKVFEGVAERILSEEILTTMNTTSDSHWLKRNILRIKWLEGLSTQLNISNPSIEEKLQRFKERITHPEAIALLSKPEADIPFQWGLEPYYHEEILRDIELNGFEHPSKIPPEAISSLLKITRHCELSRHFAKDKFSDMEKEDFLNTFLALESIPNIESLLSLFEKPPIVDSIERLLPSGFRKFISRPEHPHYKLPACISREAFDLALNYVKMMKNYQRLSQDLPKAQALLQKFREHPDQITNKDRLTIAELGQISKLARYGSTLEKIDQGHPHLQACRNQVNQAKEIIQQLEEILLPAFAEQYQNGDILGYSGKKKEAWTGRPVGLEEKLTMKIGSYSLIHGMKFYRSKTNEPKIAHVYGNYVTQNISLYETVISDGWRVHLAPLIPQECQEGLEKIFGDNATDKIQELYHQTELRIHKKIRKDKTTLKISNKNARRLKAGLANFHRLANFFGGIQGQPAPSHKVEEPQDFNILYDHLLHDKDVNESQICSEFVSKTTLLSLMKLNKILAKQMAEKYPHLVAENVLSTLQAQPLLLNDDVTEYLQGTRHFGQERKRTKRAEEELERLLKQAGFSKQEISLVFRINNNEIFDLPYDRKENLKRIDPGRMVTLLEKKKCAQRVERPDAFKALIR